MKHSLDKIILGIDPGTGTTGFGVIRFSSQRLTALNFGCVRPPAKYKISDRYLIIFDALNEIIDAFQPNFLAIETQYVKKNVQSALKLGMARGIAIVAAKKKGIDVFEYSPTKAKLAVTGTGTASKFQVQGMVGKILNIANPIPEDAADALALAICHSHYLQTSCTHTYLI